MDDLFDEFTESKTEDIGTVESTPVVENTETEEPKPKPLDTSIENDFDKAFDSEPEKEEVAAKPAESTYVKKESTGKKNLWEDYIEPVAINVSTFKSKKPHSFAFSSSVKSVPDDVILKVNKISSALYDKGWKLNTDGNKNNILGVSAYKNCNEHCDIFIPWGGFNPELKSKAKLVTPTEKARQYASAVKYKKPMPNAKFKPKNYNDLPPVIRAITANEVHMLLGAECDAPVKFVLIYTPDGAETVAASNGKMEATGITKYIIEVAEASGIPVFNLQKGDAVKRFGDFIKDIN